MSANAFAIGLCGLTIVVSPPVFAQQSSVFPRDDLTRSLVGRLDLAPIKRDAAARTVPGRQLRPYHIPSATWMLSMMSTVPIAASTMLNPPIIAVSDQVMDSLRDFIWRF